MDKKKRVGKKSKKLLKALGFVVPPVAIAAGISATTGEETKLVAEDENQLEALNVPETTSVDGVTRITDLSSVARDTSNSEYVFDSSLNSNLFYYQQQAMTGAQDINNPVALTTQESAQLDELISAANELLKAGVSINELLMLIAAFRADQEDTYTADNQAYTNYFSQPPARLPSLDALRRGVRNARNAWRVVRYIATIVAPLKLTTNVKLNTFVNYLMEESVKVVKLYPKPPLLEAGETAKRQVAFLRRSKNIVPRALRSYTVNVDEIAGFTPTPVDIDFDNLLPNTADVQKLVDDIDAVREKANPKGTIIRNADVVDGVTTTTGGFVAQEWFDDERAKYELIEKNKPYETNPGAYLDTSKKPPTLGSHLDDNDILGIVKSPSLDLDTKKFLVAELLNQFVGNKDVYTIHTITNNRFSKSNIAKINYITEEYDKKIKKVIRDGASPEDIEGKITQVQIERRAQVKKALSAGTISSVLTPEKLQLVDVKTRFQVLQKNLQRRISEIARLKAEYASIAQSLKTNTSRSEASFNRLANNVEKTSTSQLEKIGFAQDESFLTQSSRISNPSSSLQAYQEDIKKVTNRISSESLEELKEKLTKLKSFTPSAQELVNRANFLKKTATSADKIKANTQAKQLKQTALKTESLYDALDTLKIDYEKLYRWQVIFEAAQRRTKIKALIVEMKESLETAKTQTELGQVLNSYTAIIQKEENFDALDSGSAAKFKNNPTPEAVQRTQIDYVDGKIIENINIDEKVSDIISASKPKKITFRQVAKSGEINTANLKQLKKVADKIADSSKSLTEVIVKSQNIVTTVFEQYKALANQLVTIGAAYEKAYDQVYTKFPKDATDPSIVASRIQALNAIDEKFKKATAMDTKLQAIFREYYGSKELAEFSSHKEFLLATEDIKKNFQIITSDLQAGATKLLNTYNQRTASSIAQVQKSVNEISTAIAAEQPTWINIRQRLVDISKSPEAVSLAVKNAVVDISKASFEQNLIIDAFKKGFLNGVEDVIRDVQRYTNVGSQSASILEELSSLKYDITNVLIDTTTEADNVLSKVSNKDVELVRGIVVADTRPAEAWATQIKRATTIEIDAINKHATKVFNEAQSQIGSLRDYKNQFASASVDVNGRKFLKLSDTDPIFEYLNDRAGKLYPGNQVIIERAKNLYFTEDVIDDAISELVSLRNDVQEFSTLRTGTTQKLQDIRRVIAAETTRIGTVQGTITKNPGVMLYNDDVVKYKKQLAEISDSKDKIHSKVHEIQISIDDYNSILDRAHNNKVNLASRKYYQTYSLSTIADVRFQSLDKVETIIDRDALRVAGDVDVDIDKYAATDAAVNDILENGNLDDSSKKSLQSLIDLDEKIDNYNTVARDVFNWSDSNLSSLRQQRAYNVLLLNKEIIRGYANQTYLDELRKRISKLDKRIIERLTVNLRIRGKSYESIEKVLEGERKLLDYTTSPDVIIDNQEATIPTVTRVEGEEARIAERENINANINADGNIPLIDSAQTDASFDRAYKVLEAKTTVWKPASLKKLDVFSTEIRTDIRELKADILQSIQDGTKLDVEEIVKKQRSITNKINIFQKDTAEVAYSASGFVEDVDESFEASRGLVTGAADTSLEASTEVFESRKRFLVMKKRIDGLTNIGVDLRTSFDEFITAFDDVVQSNPGLTAAQKGLFKESIGVVDTTVSAVTKKATKSTLKTVSNFMDRVISWRKTAKWVDAVEAVFDNADATSILINYGGKAAGFIWSKIKTGAQLSYYKALATYTKTSIDAVELLQTTHVDDVITAIVDLQGSTKQVSVWENSIDEAQERLDDLKSRAANLEEVGDAILEQEKVIDTLKDQLKNAQSATETAIQGVKGTLNRKVDLAISNYQKQIDKVSDFTDTKLRDELIVKRDKLIGIKEGTDVTGTPADPTPGQKLIDLDADDAFRRLKDIDPDLAKEVSLIAKSELSKAKSVASETVNAAKKTFTQTQKAYNKTQSAIKKAKKAGDVVDSLDDSLSALYTSVKVAKKAALKSVDTLYAVRLAGNPLKVKKIAYLISKATSKLGIAFRSTKLFTILTKALKVLTKVSSFLSSIPIVGQVVDAIAFGISVWQLTERQKAHDTTVKWNKAAKEWKTGTELNPWAVPEEDTWKKYHPWAIGALPRPLNLGFSENLKFTDNLSNPQNHPYTTCDYETKPEGKISYPLIGKAYKGDYDTYYNTSSFKDINDPTAYFDLLDPISVIGNTIVSGSATQEEVKNELWKKTDSRFFNLSHQIWTPENATRYETGYNYPVVNKDCYFFTGKYAAKEPLVASTDLYKKTGLYKITDKVKDQLIADGAEVRGVESLTTDQPQRYYTSNDPTQNLGSTLDEAISGIRNEFPYSYFIGTEFYYNKLEKNVPSGITPFTSMATEELKTRVASTLKGINPDLSDAEKEAATKILSDKAITTDTTTYLGGLVGVAPKVSSFNTFEAGDSDPATNRNFRYVATDKSYNYINSKVEEILAYNTEQITLTLEEARSRIIETLAQDVNFRKQVQEAINGKTNSKTITPAGIKALIDSLEKASSGDDVQTPFSLLGNYDWDLHIDDFENYWSIKSTFTNDDPGAENNVANTTVINRATLSEGDSRAHPWKDLVTKNTKEIIDSIKDFINLATELQNTNVFDIIDQANKGELSKLESTINVNSKLNESIYSQNERTITEALYRIVKNMSYISLTNDPLNVLPYVTSKLFKMYRSTTLTNALVSSIEKDAKTLIDARIKWLMRDLSPIKKVETRDSSGVLVSTKYVVDTDGIDKLSSFNTTQEVQDYVTNYIQNADEIQQQSNFYLLATMLIESYNWIHTSAEGIEKSRLNFYEEKLRDRNLSSVNARTDEEFFQYLIDEGLTLENQAKWTSNVDEARIYVQQWAFDIGLFNKPDEFLAKLENSDFEGDATATEAYQYIRAQRSLRAGAKSVYSQEWDRKNKENFQNEDVNSDSYNYTPGANSLINLATWYKSEVLSGNNFVSAYQKLINLRTEEFDTKTAKQQELGQEYLDKIDDVVWQNIMNADERLKTLAAGSDPDSILQLSNRLGLVLTNNPTIRKQILDAAKPIFSAAWTTNSSFFLDETNALKLLFSQYEAKPNLSALKSYFFGSTSNTDFRRIFNNDSIKGIENTLTRYDFLDDYMARVSDYGSNYPASLQRLTVTSASQRDLIKQNAPIVLPYAIALQSITEATRAVAIQRLSEVIDQLALTNPALTLSKGRLLSILSSNIVIRVSGDSSKIGIQLKNTVSGEETIFEGIDSLDYGERRFQEYIDVMIGQVIGASTNQSNTSGSITFNNSVRDVTTNTAEVATLQAAMAIVKSDTLYKNVEDNPIATTQQQQTDFLNWAPQAVATLNTNPETPSEDDIKLWKAYWYISNNIKLDGVVKVLESDTDDTPSYVIAQSVQVESLESLQLQLADIQQKMKEFIFNKLSEIGIDIVTPSDATQIDRKSGNKIIEADKGKYLDITYTEFINKYRDNALSQNDDINDVIDTLVRAQIDAFRANLADAKKANVLFFRKSELSKTTIEYIWIYLAGRDKVKFEEELKKYSNRDTGEAIIDAAIVDLTEWQGLQEAWAKRAVNDTLSTATQDVKTFFNEDNSRKYLEGDFKTRFNDYMSKVYKLIKKDTLDFDDNFNLKGVKAFNEIAAQLGKVNNELNGLLTQAITSSLFGLRKATDPSSAQATTVNPLDQPLPLFIDRNDPNANYGIFSNELGRDLSAVPVFENPYFASSGARVVPEDRVFDYVRNIDRVLKEHVEAAFKNYVTTSSVGRYQFADRNTIYKEITSLISFNYQQYRDALSTASQAKILDGSLFKEFISKLGILNVDNLFGVFKHTVSRISDSIGSDDATDATWQKYVSDTLLDQYVKDQYLSQSNSFTTWVLEREEGFASINLLVGLSLNRAVEKYNASQLEGENGEEAYRVDTKSITEADGREIVTNVIFDSLDKFYDLLKKANEENDATILPSADNYASSIFKTLVDDLNNPDAWQDAIEKYKIKSVTLKEILDGGALSLISDLDKKEEGEYVATALLQLQKALFVSPDAIQDKKAILDLYTSYSDYLRNNQ